MVDKDWHNANNTEINPLAGAPHYELFAGKSKDVITAIDLALEKGKSLTDLTENGLYVNIQFFNSITDESFIVNVSTVKSKWKTNGIG